VSDFQQPFTGSLASFDDLKYCDAAGPDILELLAGSGGGTWLDISPSGLAQVGYIRFSQPDDSSAATSLNFELDAISISHAAVGAAVVPEPSSIDLFVVASMALLLFIGGGRVFHWQNTTPFQPQQQNDSLDEIHPQFHFTSARNFPLAGQTQYQPEPKRGNGQEC
jgi:hypothetical protein